MKIAIVATDGSPIGCTHKTIWGKDGHIGCGGSELAIMTLAEGWTKKGYECIFFNSPREMGVSPFEQRATNAFDPSEHYDVAISFRTPNIQVLNSKSQLKVFLSFDQFTSIVFVPFVHQVDKVVGISPYHSEHFKTHYGFNDMIVIDLPLRVDDFEGVSLEKIPNRIIYTSVPDRGLMNLHAIWPLILREIPDVTLRITSDYRLWGLNHPNNQKYFAAWMGLPGVTFPPNSALLREEYLQELGKSDLLLYPHKAENPELFCVSMAEAQYAGAYPVSSDMGALKTTNMGLVLPGNVEDIGWRKDCVDKVVELLSDRDELDKKRKDVMEKAYKRFNLDTVLDAWERLVFA